jgi:hypothetical protein
MAKEYIIFLNSLSNIIDKYILTNINSYEHKDKERYVPRSYDTEEYKKLCSSENPQGTQEHKTLYSSMNSTRVQLIIV